MTPTAESAAVPAAVPTAVPTAVLHRVGAGAVHWLHVHRGHFRVRTGSGASATEAKERFKPVGELAMVGRVLDREGVAGSQQAAQLKRLIDFAWYEALEAGELLAWLQRDEPFSPIPLEVYVHFRELGYVHRGIEQHTRLTAATASWAALETTPNRRLGITRCETRAGLRPSVEVSEATGRTWLGRTPEPWSVEDNIAYDITHTVFHLTDWGRHPEHLPEDIARYLGLWLPVWLEEWARKEYWDLLGELLVVDACLPRPTLEPDAWQRFAAAQSTEGAMPMHRTLPEETGEALFDAVYHPTLVALFASTMATSRALTALSTGTGTGTSTGTSTGTGAP
jgi:hypothetical protein